MVQKPKKVEQRSEHGEAPRRRRADPRLLTILRAGMVLFGGMALFLGLLLIVLPLFRVKEVRVKGNKYYSTEQILAGAQIEIGKEILAVDIDRAMQGVINACPFMEEISIKSDSPSSICITVKETPNVMYMAFNGKYVAFDSSFHVLGESTDPTAYAPFLKVKLPAISGLAVGGEIYFADPEMNMDYVQTLLSKLEEEDILRRVTSIDFSQKFQVSYVIRDTCKIKIGKVDRLDIKLQLVDEIIAKSSEDDEYVMIDVSSTEKSTRRVVSKEEFFAE